MDLEKLRVKLLATNQLSKQLSQTAVSADRVASSMREGAVAGAELAAGMSRSENEASTLASHLDAANRQLVAGTAQGAIYAEGMDDVAQAQAEASASAALLEGRIEGIGDEATQSAAKLGVFETAADSATSSTIRANLGGLSGSVTKIGASAAAATPPLLALGGALAGVAGFGGALAAGAFGFTAGGIQSRAEEMARFSAELETAADAREQLLSDFAGRLEAATDALQTPAAEQFALANMQAVVDVAGEAADALAAVQPTIFAVAGGLREAFVATSPALFGELATQTEQLAPLFLELRGTIRRLPELIAYLGDVTQRIGPDLFTLGSALVELGGGAITAGTAILDVLLPPLNAALFVAGGVLSVFELLPEPLQNATAAFGVVAGGALVASAAMSVLTTTTVGMTLATEGLIAALGTLFAPITATVVAIGALAAVGAGLLTHFGLLDDAARMVANTWNGLVQVAETVVNGILWLSETVTDAVGPFAALIPGIGPAIVILGNLDEIVRTVGAGIDWLAGKIRKLAEWADKYLAPVIDAFERLNQRAEQEGGVDFSAAEVGRGDSGDDSSGSSDTPTPPPAPRAPGASPSGSGSPSGSEVTVDMSNSEFGGSTTKSDVKRWVVEGVKEANSTSRRREDAQGG